MRRLLLLPLAALVVHAKTASVPESPGQRKDGSVLLPNQWSLRPVGKQVAVGDYPVNIAIHPGGRFVAVLHCGYGDNEIIILDLRKSAIVSRTNVPEAFYGLSFSRDGTHIYCSGAGSEVLHGFRFSEGYLGDHEQLRIRAVTERGIPAGFAVNGEGD